VAWQPSRITIARLVQAERCRCQIHFITFTFYCFPLRKEVEYATEQYSREETMLRLFISAALLTLLIGTPNIAQAQGPWGGYGYPPPGYGYGYRENPCPDGFTVQDGVCQPYRGPRGGYGYRENPCPNGFTVQGGVCQPYRGPRGGYGYGYRENPCRSGFTVQDGVCKPYRGY
jgi:hypothetical protein